MIEDIKSETLNLIAQNKSILLKDRIIFENELKSRGEELELIPKKNQNIKFNSDIFKGYSLMLLVMPVLYLNYISAKTLVNQGQKAQNQFYATCIFIWVILHHLFLLYNL